MLSVNAIVAENALTGTPQSVWDVAGAGDPAIQGFATDISVNVGQTVHFKINDTASAKYHIDIYRMGYYHGLGARLQGSIDSTQTIRKVQPAPLTDSATGLLDCGNWSETASWAVPSTAVSGIYFAKVVREDTGGASRIVFIVRNDASHSDLLFQTSDSTWQAYNSYGGNSIYGPGGDIDDRAYKVSYNRPLVVEGSGGGLGDYNSPFHGEYPMVRWLERNGYDVTYFTDVDSDRNGALIKNHKAFLSVGHDEYWSGQQRANVEAARDAGVNLAFFSGNEVFWKTRWETSISADGTPYRTLVCYKESRVDGGVDPTNVWTGTWRDGRFSPPKDGGRPENALTGTMYMADRTSVDIGISMTVPSTFSSLRFWRDTVVASLLPGQTATLGDRIVGYETDEDVDNGFRPAGLFDMSSTTFTTTSKVLGPNGGTVVGPGTSTHSITLYRAASGALVFGAGTVQWSWGLDGNHNDGAGTEDVNIQQATVNLFADMGIQPTTIQLNLKQQSMSTDLTRPTSTITTPTAGLNVTAAVPVTISGTAFDAGGGVVAGVEVSTDGGQTWHPATGRSNWTYTWTPALPGPATILTRAVDDSGNVEAAGGGVPVSIHYAPTSATGLVAAYNFDQGAGNTLTDYSGLGNNGAISGAAWTAGRHGGALSFDGSTSVVTIANSASLQLTTGMTLEAWVNPASFADWSAIIYKPRSADGLTYALYATDGAARPPSGYVGVNNVDNAAIAPSRLSAGAWYHLALTYDNSLLNLYLNGNLVSSTAVTGSLQNSTRALTLGNDNINEAFHGLIDDVRVYNRALTPTEIGVDMSQAVGGALDSTAPTVALTGPAAGASVSGTTTVSAAASDDVGVAGVQFLINGKPLGSEDTAGPYSVNWNTLGLPNGSYVLSARVRDFAGNVTTSSGVTVTVANAPDVAAPTATLPGLTAGSTVGGSTVLLSAAASDNIGITGVQFRVNGVDVGPLLTTAPYRLAWTPPAGMSGTATITVVAYDAAGNAGTSSVNVTVDSKAPAVTGYTPTNGSTGLLTNTSVSVSFDETVQAGTPVFTVIDGAGHSVTGRMTYDDATHTVTFIPDGSLSPSTTYQVTVSGTRDAVGNGMSGSVSWSFTTVNSITGATIWSSAEAPVNASTDDARGVELGVRFRSDLSGYITGIRFYKGALNTGIHTAHLWTSSGTLLATGTFVNETATGWQQVNFLNPVAIAANTTYVASYYAPSGGYAADGGYFTTASDSAPLHAAADATGAGNGLYLYGGGFPTASYNATNYWVDVVFGTTNIVQDTKPPTVDAHAPSVNASNVPTTAAITATFSESVQPDTLSFLLTDPAGNVVTATVAYDDAAHTATLTPSTPLAPSITYTVTVSGAKDLAGNAMTSAVIWSFTTGTATAEAPASSIWGGGAAPVNPSANDANAVQVGMKFRSDVNGYIDGIRFYKGAGNTGTHVGYLWSAGGTLLASVTFVNETASGWQQMQFSSPVAITANTVYVVSYYAPNGHYASDNAFFAAGGVDNGTLHALSNTAAGGNGVYVYGGALAFPANSYNATNYWVDVVFSTAPADTIAPAVTVQTPAPNATGVSVSAPVTVGFNKAIQPGTLSFVLRDSGGNVVPATVSYNSTTFVATLTPTSPLANLGTYTVTVSGAKDTAGNPMDAAVTWSFTTSPVISGASLFSTTAIPTTASVNDTHAVELGVKFVADYDGYISGIRFYKGALNTGTHVAHLWGADGTLLGTATFSGETGTGWQFATFSSPIAISAGKTYVASYFAPNGGYALDSAYFTAGTDNGPLHAPAAGSAGGNGVFFYGASGGFPTDTFNASNYWVDVVYGTVLDATAPVVTARTPAPGATGVALSAAVSVTFDNAVQAGSISLVLKDGGGNVLASTVAYDAVTQVATLAPTAQLQPGVTYTVTLSGATDLAGNTMTTPVTWTFTTTNAGSVTQTTAGDFGAGTTAGTVVTPTGEVELTPTAFDDFSGTSLGSAWTTSSWTSAGGGTTVVEVSSGTLSVAGAQVVSAATYVGTAIEGSVAFGAAPYQNFGLATGLAAEFNNYWAMFGTAGTSTNLYARVNVAGALTNVDLGAIPSGLHKYRIQPVTGGFQFFVDGVLRTTVDTTGMPASTPMNAVVSTFTGTAIQVDWAGVGSYTGSGTFTSAVIDAGRSVSWSTIDWNAVLPAGTSILVETRSGSSAIPDGAWSAWSTATDGAAVGSPAGRYLQYRVTLTTTDPNATAALSDILLSW